MVDCDAMCKMNIITKLFVGVVLYEQLPMLISALIVNRRSSHLELILYFRPQVAQQRWLISSW